MIKREHRLPGSRPAASAAAALAAVAVLAGCGSSGSGSAASGSSSVPSSSSPPSGSTAYLPSPAAVKAAGFENYFETLAPPNFKPPAKTYKIAVVTATTLLPQQASIVIGARDAAKKYGAQVTVYDAGGFQNVSKQVSQFETAVATHPDAILLLPASPVAFNSQIAQARAAGIKVLPMLIPPPTAKYDFALADDLPFDAATSVDSLAKALNGKGNLYAIQGGAGTTVAALFQQGMQSELKKYPGLKIVYSKNLQGFPITDAQSAAENALVAQPNVNGIITNDTILGLGAAHAVQTRGKKGVVIAGIGPGDKQTIDALRDGLETIGATPPFYAVGYTSVQWALALLDGMKPAQTTLRLNPMVLTKSNIGAALSSGALYQVLAPSSIGCGPGQPSSC
jgi:ABC-type sugar transport system substrate-binding protein